MDSFSLFQVPLQQIAIATISIITTIGIYTVVKNRIIRNKLFANGKQKAEALNQPQSLLLEHSNLVDDELRNKVMSI